MKPCQYWELITVSTKQNSKLDHIFKISGIGASSPSLTRHGVRNLATLICLLVPQVHFVKHVQNCKVVVGILDISDCLAEVAGRLRDFHAELESVGDTCGLLIEVDCFFCVLHLMMCVFLFFIKYAKIHY